MVPVPEVRYMYGNIFLYVLYIDVGLNLVLLGYEITRMVVRSCKRRILHKKLRFERKRKLEEKALSNQVKPKEVKKTIKKTVTETKKPKLALILEESKEESSMDESRRRRIREKKNRDHLILKNEIPDQ
jgi:hypothetical protein